jgi:leader peptidase (prepilin peptidase)/N-methyltransferase
MWLRARCRDCHAAIPVRYPFVEALIAAVFAGLAAVTFFRSGSHLPSADGVKWSLEMLAGIYAYHLVLLVTLAAAAFIGYDGFAVPWKVAVPALVAGIAAPAIWPWLHPLPVWPGWDPQTIQRDWLAGLASSSAGATAGLVVALLAFPLGLARQGDDRQRTAWRSIALSAALTGSYLGWSAMIGIGAVVSVAYLVLSVTVSRLTAPKRVPWTGVLFVATFVWIVAWEPLFVRFTYAQWNDVQVVFYLGVVILCASALTRTLAPKPNPPADV